MSDKSVKVLDTDPVLEKHYRGHTDVVTGLAFNPNGKQLLSCGKDSSLIIWNIQQSVRCYKFVGHTDAILTATFSPDGCLVATGSRDRTVRLWTPKMKGECVEFRAHTSAVRSVDFSPDGSKLVTGSDDKIIKLWSSVDSKFLTSYVGHTNWVRCVRFSPVDKQLLSCSDDKTSRLTDYSTGQNIHIFHELKSSPVHAEFHPNACVIAVALSNGTVKLYDTRTRKLQQHYQIHEESLSQVSFHSSGNYLLTASLDSTMKILDLLEGRPIYTLKGHLGPIKSVAFSGDGTYFASGGADHNVLVWKTCLDNGLEIDKNCDKEITANMADEKVIKNVCSNSNQMRGGADSKIPVKPPRLDTIYSASSTKQIVSRKDLVDNSSIQFENYGTLLKDVGEKLDQVTDKLDRFTERINEVFGSGDDETLKSTNSKLSKNSSSTLSLDKVLVDVTQKSNEISQKLEAALRKMDQLGIGS